MAINVSLNFKNKDVMEFRGINDETGDACYGKVYLCSSNSHLVWDRDAPKQLQDAVVSTIVDRLRQAKLPCLTM